MSNQEAKMYSGFKGGCLLKSKMPCYKHSLSAGCKVAVWWSSISSDHGNLWFFPSQSLKTWANTYLVPLRMTNHTLA